MFQVVIFGASGDLSTKKIVPSLFSLFINNKLPENFEIIGFSRREWSDEDYRNVSKEFILNHLQSSNLDSNIYKSREKIDFFLSRLYFVRGEFHDDQAYENLSKKINTTNDVIFYLSVSPEFYELIIDKFKSSSLSKFAQVISNRLVIEKPFGNDYSSALKLNNKLLEIFTEEQIYRIDHILGRDTLQDILYFRANNYIFEKLLTNEHIDHIQISYIEDIGIEERGEFYEHTGVIRDMVQNHLLQILAISTLDLPDKINSDSLKKARCNLIDTLDTKNTFFISGQYVENKNTGSKGYRQEKKVNSNSIQATYVEIKTFLNHPKWSGVPIYFKTGKGLDRQLNQILFVFKDKENLLEAKKLNEKKSNLENKNDPDKNEKLLPNILGFRLKPQEGVFLNLTKSDHTSYTNTDADLNNVSLDFCYKSKLKNSYENLLYNVISSDKTYFVSINEVLKSWEFVDSMTVSVEKGRSKLYFYERGTKGPVNGSNAQVELIKDDGRKWYLDEFSSVCRI